MDYSGSEESKDDLLITFDLPAENVTKKKSFSKSFSVAPQQDSFKKEETEPEIRAKNFETQMQTVEEDSLNNLNFDFIENSVSDMANASHTMNNTQNSFNLANSKAMSKLVDKNSREPSKSINLFIQMEYCANGSLSKFLKRNGELNSGEIFLIFTEILNGLIYIHEKGFIHRDLKPGNIFISKNGVIKIGDFGLITYIKRDQIQDVEEEEHKSKSISTSPIKRPRVILKKETSLVKQTTLDSTKCSENMKDTPEVVDDKINNIGFRNKESLTISPVNPIKKRSHNKSIKETLKKSFIEQPPKYITGTLNLSTKIGTPFYTAPECQTDSQYDYKADVYSLGVILLELFSKFTTMHERNVVFTGFKKEGRVSKEFREKYDVVSDLVELLCRHDPKKRPYASEVKESVEYKMWLDQFN